MMKTLDIGIADIALRIECSDETFLQALLRERYEAFVLTNIQQPHVRITLHPKSTPPPRVRMESVKVRQAEGGWRFVYDTFVADVTAEAGYAEVDCLSSVFAVDSFLRTLLALILPPRNGLLVHASAVRLGERGYVFAGRSGAGKTTVARLLVDRAEVLSDELVALRRTLSEWRVYGTPFWGDFARAGVNLSAPLRAIYLLHQHREHRLETLSRRDAMAGILQCSLQFAEGVQIAEWMLNVVSRLVKDVPVYRLQFLPDVGFWEVVTRG